MMAALRFDLSVMFSVANSGPSESSTLGAGSTEL